MKMKITWAGVSPLILSVVLVALGFWHFTQAQGSEIEVCVKKSGLVYVIGNGFRRSECRKNDTLLSWNTTGPQGEKGDKGDEGEPGPQGIQGTKGDKGESGTETSLHLYDASNQDLGILIGPSLSDKNIDTYIPSIQAAARFTQDASSTAALNLHRRDLYFDAENCIGSSYILAATSTALATDMVYLFYSSSTPPRIFKIDTPAPLTLVLKSRTSVACSNISELRQAIPVHEIVVPFNLPLTWPLQIQSN